MSRVALAAMPAGVLAHQSGDALGDPEVPKTGVKKLCSWSAPVANSPAASRENRLPHAGSDDRCLPQPDARVRLLRFRFGVVGLAAATGVANDYVVRRLRRSDVARTGSDARDERQHEGAAQGRTVGRLATKFAATMAAASIENLA